MSRRRPQPPEEPGKPLTGMTPEELAAFRTKLRREIRDRQVATGTKKPRTMREMQIWLEARGKQDERQARRIARAERRGGRIVSEGDGERPEE